MPAPEVEGVAFPTPIVVAKEGVVNVAIVPDAAGKVTVTEPAIAGALKVTEPLVSPETITLDILNPLYHNTTQREPLETVTTAPEATVIGPADEPENPAAIV
jgi:hypothetical protein